MKYDTVLTFSSHSRPIGNNFIKTSLFTDYSVQVGVWAYSSFIFVQWGGTNDAFTILIYHKWASYLEYISLSTPCFQHNILNPQSIT